MGSLTTDHLLAFARRLQNATSFAELLAEARIEIQRVANYQHAWLLVADDTDPDLLLVIEVAGSRGELVLAAVPTLKISGDALLMELVASDVPIVIEDARTDPRTNKALVEQLQNRTLINIPLRLLDKPMGVFGLGTFGDEGCHAPTDEQLGYFVAMAAQISVAAGRIRYTELEREAEREHRELEQRLSQIQRLESLGLLAGGVAHDFNNLLTVIVSSLAMATQDIRSRGAGFNSLLEDIHFASEAAERAGKLTRQLLAMGKNQTLRVQLLQMNDQLKTLVELLKRLLPENIEITLIEKPLPPLPGDGPQLDQVFINLALNSRDAMPEGGRITIETELVHVNGKYVQTHPWARAGEYVLVTVTDTGTGIPRDVIDKIFDPFFTTKTPDRGTGLGLSVSYGIIRQHDGMIHCYSEPDRGTVFRVYLPIASPGDRRVVIPDSSPPEEKATGRILVVDDDVGVVQIVVRILGNAGYTVISAASGQEALDVLDTSPVDLVLLDMVMPGLSSEDVLDRLHEKSRTFEVILSSGYSAEAQGFQTLLQKTGHPMLTKPYDPDGLLRAVRRALRKP